MRYAYAGVGQLQAGVTPGVNVGFTVAEVAFPPAAPFIAIGQIVTDLIIGILGKPNEYKIATTNIVNKLEPYFQQNVNTWLGFSTS